MYVQVFKPTENPRFNELIGFLGITLATLAALSLLSYNPLDPSLNVAAPPADGHPARNWIGPVGAHASDVHARHQCRWRRLLGSITPKFRSDLSSTVLT